MGGATTKTSKLSRELRRVQGQAFEAGRFFRCKLGAALWPVARRYRLRLEPGEQPFAGQIALVVIYQPRGLQSSTLVTLRHLVERGFAPLIVCNGGVRAADLAQLRPLAWRILTRPNLGFDFGGYRDGILHLREAGITPERLLVMNDTIWLPALAPEAQAPQADVLTRLMGLGADYAALSNFIYRPRAGRARDLVGAAYPASFCFMVSKAVWQAPEFIDFWARMPLEATKARVVQSGEVGFGLAMKAAGFKPELLLDTDEIAAAVAQLPPQAQAEFLARVPVVRHSRRAALEAMVADPQARPAARAAFLSELMVELNPWDSLAVNGLIGLKADFLKKTNLKKPDNARRFLAMAEASGLALAPELRRELVALAGKP